MRDSVDPIGAVSERSPKLDVRSLDAKKSQTARRRDDARRGHSLTGQVPASHAVSRPGR